MKNLLPPHYPKISQKYLQKIRSIRLRLRQHLNYQSVQLKSQRFRSKFRLYPQRQGRSLVRRNQLQKNLRTLRYRIQLLKRLYKDLYKRPHRGVLLRLRKSLFPRHDFRQETQRRSSQ